jgi:hypothetical protein
VRFGCAANEAKLGDGAGIAGAKVGGPLLDGSGGA